MDIISLITILVGFIAMISITIGFHFHLVNKIDEMQKEMHKMSIEILWIKFQLGHIPDFEKEEKANEEPKEN